MIVIVEYGSGNLRSIQKSVSLFYDDVQISRDLSLIKQANALILPGVGAFGDAIRELKAARVFNYLKNNLTALPLLGICLGMQLLFSNSEESKGIEGLNIIRGNVVRLKKYPKIRIPHTGWNRLIPTSKPHFHGYAYFNHSYSCRPEDIDLIVSYVNHGQSIPAIIVKDNIIGTQFHPEKSKEAGKKIIEYFISQIERKV